MRIIKYIQSYLRRGAYNGLSPKKDIKQQIPLSTLKNSFKGVSPSSHNATIHYLIGSVLMIYKNRTLDRLS